MVEQHATPESSTTTTSSSTSLESRPTAPPPAPTSSQRQVPEPPPRSFPLSFGWTLVALATLGLALGSWDLYPDNGPEGMWAGYRDLLVIIVLGYTLAALRCNVTKTPFIGICGLAGVALIAEGVFLSSTTVIVFTEIAAGAVMVLGAALMASASDR